MTQDLILANARLVLPGETLTGSLVLRDGRIADIAGGAAVPTGAVDCDGDYVAPGMVELHTDNLERHISPRPRVSWPHQAAMMAHDAELAGTGITTVFDAMRVGLVTSDGVDQTRYARELASEMLDLRARKALKISHFLHLRAEICSDSLLEEMAEFGPEDRIGIVSLMDHTPGQRQFRDLTKLKSYVMGKRGLNEAEFTEHVATLKELRARHGDRHEAGAVAEARRFGAVLASHDDTTEEQVAASQAHGARIAEFPTTMEAAKACRDRGLSVIMGAPNLVRGGSHSGNVAAHELAREGLLDILSSDYVPAALLLAAVQLGDLWGDMAHGIATVSRAPARAAGLEDRGELAIGQRADLIRFRRLEGVPGLRGVWSAGHRVA
ncbi:alpha-D-ribose 1-methylphosphonate 5-triphosphate diphosphatase [Salinihabitans flavidus]|uniref:Alpha-D-ribose 1-methylphosphonate 5-triphosphate diphosphatase n=1 Tax=Salinihabitans flavidus TaxID=569882 RepID=A0A1H8QX66_9RHOB|nr:alpha-D-ribose 1-methylphosphonate 5-triphosphate diphosphatase [Salinihabitans flavidus]SEO58464.1 alpha-D-ribose 1-methylphosphonate 5-triphosphate diphosphatase [Salinihabitans flavidus]